MTNFHTHTGRLIMWVKKTTSPWSQTM